MGKITILNEQLANQIAAGEVVERPASVVKELVENSIDANSTVIKIEIEEGGLQSIKVTDNGDGIANEDCLLAFERHATSKIKHERDLFSIRTLGFRGEALPSIASVSRTEMKTSTGEGLGTHLVIEAGEVKHHSVAPSRKGTEVTVTRLFFNTPARLKHLKTVHTELGNISDVVIRLAMAHPEIAFQLFHNGKQLLKTDGKNDLLQVIASAYGVSVAKNMVSFHNQSLDFTLTGYTTKPTETRASRKYLSLFINGRYIRNYKLANAILEGYHTFLPVGRYPISVVHIQMDPTLIDINVHPAKLEARISKEEELMELVKTTIQQALQKTNVIPEIKAEKPKNEKPKQAAFSFHFPTKNDEKRAIEHVWGDEFTDIVHAKVQREEKLPYPAPVEKTQADEKQKHAEEVERTEEEKPAFPELHPVGQVHGTYIVAQNDEGLYLIDQHAAQERIKYEYYYDKLGETSNDLQDLLIPITFELSLREKQLVEEHRELFESFGIHFEPFGERTYIVRSHPSWFPKGQEEETIRNIVDLLLEEKTFDLKKLREETAMMMACKQSIKANQFLTQDEMATLLKTLKMCRSPYTCPHGRPVMVHFSTYELKKMFKRVM